MLDIQTKGTVIHWCLFTLFALGFVTFLVPVFAGILNLGNGIGMLFFAALASVTLFWNKLTDLMQHKPFRAVIIIVTSIAVVLIILAGVISTYMVKTANNKSQNAAVIIVLGCRVKGEKPSLMLEKRINAAYDYLMANPTAVAILSGGQGSDEMISEAECMYRELTKKGISAERLLKEDKSTNTYENIRNSVSIMKNNGIEGEIAIVSNEFHLGRAKLIAQKQGYETTSVSAKTAWYLLPTYWVRDCIGVAYEVVF